MTRLAWGTVGKRFYEAGVDRGVLYLDGADGIAWNGLVSVSESPTGGEVSAYYVDGYKYLENAASENFEATIEAYTYPDEFSVCEGTTPVTNGLFMTHQRKKSFGLCYRSKIGNDVDGMDHAYKLHLVYNALAAPSEHAHNTLTEEISPDNFSWKITTTPPDFAGYKPTAHLVIDTRDAPGGLIRQIEDILYGTDVDAARQPSPSELIFLFNSYGASVFDAGDPDEPYYITFDGGVEPDVVQTSTIDGGTP